MKQTWKRRSKGRQREVDSNFGKMKTDEILSMYVQEAKFKMKKAYV